MSEKSAAEHLDRITIALDEACLARNCAHKSACRCSACVLESGARESLTALRNGIACNDALLTERTRIMNEQRNQIAEMERHCKSWETATSDVQIKLDCAWKTHNNYADKVERALGAITDAEASLPIPEIIAGRTERIAALIVERDQARARSEALLTRKREMLGRIDSLEEALRKIEADTYDPQAVRVARAALSSTATSKEPAPVIPAFLLNMSTEQRKSFVERLNNATKEEIAQAMEKLPTDALEWAVKFEAMGSPAIPTPSVEAEANRAADAKLRQALNEAREVIQALAGCLPHHMYVYGAYGESWSTNPTTDEYEVVEFQTTLDVIDDALALPTPPTPPTPKEHALATKGLPVEEQPSTAVKDSADLRPCAVVKESLTTEFGEPR